MASHWLIAIADMPLGPTKTKERSRKRARAPMAERTGFRCHQHGTRLRLLPRGSRPWSGESFLPVAGVDPMTFQLAAWFLTDCRSYESRTLPECSYVNRTSSTPPGVIILAVFFGSSAHLRGLGVRPKLIQDPRVCQFCGGVFRILLPECKTQNCESRLHICYRVPKVSRLRVSLAQQHVFPTSEPMLLAARPLHQFQRALIGCDGCGSMVLSDGKPSLGFTEKSLIIVDKIRRGIRLVRCLLQVVPCFSDPTSSESKFRQAC